MRPRQASATTIRAVIALGLLAMVVPGSSPAAMHRPRLAVDPQTITPYTSSGCLDRREECYQAFGFVEPGARVLLTISDEDGLSVRAEVRALTSDDPGTPEDETGFWAASPNVTDLGSHNGDASILTFTAVITTVEGEFISQEQLSGIEKLSATSGDDRGPKITIHKAPPGGWCHTGVGIGCSNSTCLIGTALLVMPIQAEGAPPPCSAPEVISGVVEDARSENFGIGSEIQDVAIEIIKLDDESYKREFHPFLRRGTSAFFSETLEIDEFEPGDYEIRISAVDALGNAAEDEFANFTVTYT